MIKKLINILVLIAVIGLFGCATGPDGKVNIRAEAAAWSQDIAMLTLIAKPDYRPILEAVVRGLDSSEQAGGLNIDTISSALLNLNVLQSKDSKLAVIGGRLVLRRALGSMKLETPEALNEAGLGIRDGLKAALGS